MSWMIDSTRLAGWGEVYDDTQVAYLRIYGVMYVILSIANMILTINYQFI